MNTSGKRTDELGTGKWGGKTTCLKLY